jgi:polyisoprenoid-binding protein YceI
MNKLALALGIILVAGFGLYVLTPTSVVDKGAAMEEKTDVPGLSSATLEVGEYRIDTASSRVVWSAGKPAIAGYVHTGAFSLSEGSLEIGEAGASGSFVIDMNSLKVLSLGGGKEGKESALEAHLKRSDIFDVEQYPTASFRLTDISPKVAPSPSQTTYTASGELTMKGVTKPLSFPLTIIASSSNEALVSGSFEIDRTEWGITFGSAKVAEKITDQLIGDTVALELSVRILK